MKGKRPRPTDRHAAAFARVTEEDLGALAPPEPLKWDDVRWGDAVGAPPEQARAGAVETPPARPNPQDTTTEPPPVDPSAAVPPELAATIERLAREVAGLRSEVAQRDAAVADQGLAAQRGLVALAESLRAAVGAVGAEVATLRSEVARQATQAKSAAPPLPTPAPGGRADAAMAEMARDLTELRLAVAQQADDLEQGLATVQQLPRVLGQLVEQRLGEPAERRAELQNALSEVTAAVRSTLVEERDHLRGELEIHAAAVQGLQAAFQAAREALAAPLEAFRADVGAVVEELTVVARQQAEQAKATQHLRSVLESSLADHRDDVAKRLDGQRAHLGTLVEDLDASLRRVGDRSAEGIAEVNQQVGAVRRDVKRSSAETTTKVEGLGTELMGALAKGFTEQAKGLAEQAKGLQQLPVALGTALAERSRAWEAALTQAFERFEASLTEHRTQGAEAADAYRADLGTLAEALGRLQAANRSELRALVAATIDGANVSLAAFQKELYERLERVVDVTAQSSASAATAVKALGADFEAITASDAELRAAIAELRDAVADLRQKVPARVALYLPESQLAAIAEAVRPGHRPAPPRPPAPPRKAAPPRAKKAR